MTTIYIPRRIETAEQAEALAEGAVLIREGHFAFQKYAGQFVSADPHDLPVAHAWEVIGWSALVPTEAEEQTTFPIEEPEGTAYIGYGAAFDTPHRRLVTPWEEA